MTFSHVVAKKFVRVISKLGRLIINSLKRQWRICSQLASPRANRWNVNSKIVTSKIEECSSKNYMRKSRGDIIKVSTLFEKYKTILKAPQGTVVKQVIEVIEDLTTIRLSEKYIKYSVQSRTLTITAPSALKQELALHRDEIIIHLKARLGERNAPKLIF